MSSSLPQTTTERAKQDLPLEELRALGPHDHACFIYDSADEWPAGVIVPFLTVGLERHEKCLYIVEAQHADLVRERLCQEGIDPARLETSGQLALYETESYTRRLSFDPNRMIVALIAETREAVDQGYAALRVTDEMAWALRGRPGSEKLLEYEAKLNRDVVPRYPSVVLCQYHRGKFDAEIVKGAIMAHPVVVLRDHVYRNSYYIPPEDLISSKRAEHEMEHLLRTLQRQDQTDSRIKAMQETVEVMAQTLEARDPHSAGHQERVARLASAIALEMALPPERITAIPQAGMLHDIGKMYLSADLLTKPGRLTEEEFRQVKAHPRAGYELLKRMGFPHPIPETVLQHHERRDGSGYPLGLSGQSILLEARILAVADAVEAMSFSRAFRQAFGIAHALEDISRNKAVLFDPDVVEACLTLFKQKGFRFQ
jgi:putative nucleotidyltransferase with HDIG domain